MRSGTWDQIRPGPVCERCQRGGLRPAPVVKALGSAAFPAKANLCPSLFQFCELGGGRCWLFSGDRLRRGVCATCACVRVHVCMHVCNGALQDLSVICTLLSVLSSLRSLCLSIH